MRPSPEEISEMLVAWDNGDREALDYLNVEETAEGLGREGDARVAAGKSLAASRIEQR